MSLNYYRLYLKDTLDLSKTMVIKVDAVAQAINKKLLQRRQPVDQDNPHSWKYYLNLAGRYHPSDRRIYVTSLDSLEQIEFSAQTLKQHHATRQAYAYGSRFYRDLINSYPEQESFILGSLYPVDLDEAIKAKDFSVVGYPKHLINTREVSLVNNINQWLLNFKERWYNVQFNLTDQNYLSALLGVMYLQLPSLLLTLRLKACKTNEAHTFHIREYLKSHNMLDAYLSNMTEKQALFFYRNINYIERNSGKKHVFDWLVEKVMTDRNLPLSEFNMHHETDNLLTDLKPSVSFRKRLINEETKVFDHDLGFYNLAYILSKEEPDALGNSLYRQNNEKSIESKFLYAKKNFYKTKVLESSMFDYSDSTVITLQDITLNNWIYLSQKDILRTFINIHNPVNGVVSTVPNKVAFLSFLYAYCKAHDVKVNTIPAMLAWRVPISENILTKEDVLKVVDQNYCPREYIDYIFALHKHHEPMVSVQDFKEWSQKHYVAALKQLYFVSNHEHYYTRGLVHNAVERMYQHAFIQNEFTGKTFEEVFKEYHLNLDGIKDSDWFELYKEIYFSCTGQKMDITHSVSELQKAMVSLMKQLSSYSIQFLQSINKSSIKVINWAALRLGDMSLKGRAYFQVQNTLMRIFENQIKSNPFFKIDYKDLQYRFSFGVNLNVGLLNAPVGITKPPQFSSNKRFNIGTWLLNYDLKLECLNGKFKDLPLFKPYYDLSEEDKAKVKDIYTDYPTEDDYIPLVNVDALTKEKQTKFKFNHPKKNILDSYVYFYIKKYYKSFYNNNITVILDAFHNNVEINYIDQHKLFKGFYKVDSFKYVPNVPEVIELDGKVYTGGIEMGELFRIKRKGTSSYTLDGLNFRDDKLETEVRYQGDSIVLENKYFHPVTATFSLIQRDEKETITLKSTSHTAELAGISYRGDNSIYNTLNGSISAVLETKKSDINPRGTMIHFFDSITLENNLKPFYSRLNLGSINHKAVNEVITLKQGNDSKDIGSFKVNFVTTHIQYENMKPIYYRLQIDTKPSAGAAILPGLKNGSYSSEVDLTNWLVP